MRDKRKRRKAIQPSSNIDTFLCHVCGRLCASRIGLHSHNRTHANTNTDWGRDPSYRRLTPYLNNTRKQKAAVFVQSMPYTWTYRIEHTFQIILVESLDSTSAHTNTHTHARTHTHTHAHIFIIFICSYRTLIPEAREALDKGNSQIGGPYSIIDSILILKKMFAMKMLGDVIVLPKHFGPLHCIWLRGKKSMFVSVGPIIVYFYLHYICIAIDNMFKCIAFEYTQLLQYFTAGSRFVCNIVPLRSTKRSWVIRLRL